MEKADDSNIAVMFYLENDRFHLQVHVPSEFWSQRLPTKINKRQNQMALPFLWDDFIYELLLQFPS